MFVVSMLGTRPWKDIAIAERTRSHLDHPLHPLHHLNFLGLAACCWWSPSLGWSGLTWWRHFSSGCIKWLSPSITNLKTTTTRETVGETNIKNIILDLYKCDKLPPVWSSNCHKEADIIPDNYGIWSLIFILASKCYPVDDSGISSTVNKSFAN